MLTLMTGRIASVLSCRNETNATALFLTGAYTPLLPRAISYSSVNTTRPRSPSSTDPSTSTNQLNSSWTLWYTKHSNMHIPDTFPPRRLLLLLHPFHGFSRTTWVSWHQKSNHSGFYWSKKWWGGSGISWTICKSFAPDSRQKTTPIPHHSVFTDRMPFLSPNQQHQSTGDTTLCAICRMIPKWKTINYRKNHFLRQRLSSHNYKTNTHLNCPLFQDN